MPKPTKVPLQVAKEASSPSLKPQKPARRVFSAAYKLRIVREADACTQPGQLEALLRREGLYSSYLSDWRKALRLYGEDGLKSRSPGRKPSRDQRDDQISRLSRENARLEKELATAKKLLELQKKVSELLGIELGNSEES